MTVEAIDDKELKYLLSLVLFIQFQYKQKHGKKNWHY